MSDSAPSSSQPPTDHSEASANHDIFPHHVVPAHCVQRIDQVPFHKRDWHGLACRALLFLPFLLFDKLLHANKVRYMKKPHEGWMKKDKLYAHFKKMCEEARQKGTYRHRHLPNWDRVEKRLDNSPEDETSNANVRLIFLLMKNLFLVKHLFTFGQRKVRRGTVHLLQTSASPMLYFELMEGEVFNRMPKIQDKVFHAPDETCYQRYTLQPDTLYLIPARRIYVIVTIKKTLFSLHVIPEAEAHLFPDSVDPTRDRKLRDNKFNICPTPARRPEEDEDMVVVLEDDWLPREAVSSTSRSYPFVPPPPSEWNVSVMPPPPPPPPAAAVRPTKRSRQVVVETPRLMDAATNTDPLEEALHYLIGQTSAEWCAPAAPWPSAVTPAASPPPAHLSSNVAPPPSPSVSTDEEAPLDLSVREAAVLPDDPAVPPENEEALDLSILMETTHSNDSLPDEPDHQPIDSQNPDDDSLDFLDSFNLEQSSDERVHNTENNLF